MEVAESKYVIVLDRELPAGLAANACAVLSASVGAREPRLRGSDVPDASGGLHQGITRLPIAVLTTDQARLREIRARAHAAELWVVGFTRTAQRSKHYAHYAERMSGTPDHDLEYLGIALFGDKPLVAGLTGDLPLLR